MGDKKCALLIASFEYEDSYFRRLKAPLHDVNGLSRVLSHPSMGGFDDVKILPNEPRDKLSLAIEDFFADRDRGDLLLLYFSGHGIKDADGRLFYATRNTRHERLVSTALPAYQVNDLIAKSRSRRKILVLDCCYSGAFAKTDLAKGTATVGVLEEFSQGQGLVTLTSSDAFQYSFEGEVVGTGSPYSVFTRALVEGIETGKADADGDQLISLDELYRYAFDRVRQDNPHQSPRKSGEVEGDIFVARNPQPPQAAELPSEYQGAIESPIAEVREAIVPKLHQFLRGRNKGLALAALEALRRLTLDDSRRVANAAQQSLDAFDAVRQLEGQVVLTAEPDSLRRNKDKTPRAAASAAEGVILDKAQQTSLARKAVDAEAEQKTREEVEHQEWERKKVESQSSTAIREEPARGGGVRKWGALITAFYALILICLLVPGAAFLARSSSPGRSDSVLAPYDVWLTWILILIVVASQALLLFLSVDTSKQRLKPRARILVSCLVIGTLWALLTGAAILSLGFAIYGDHFGVSFLVRGGNVLASLGAIWAAWTIVFYLYFRKSSALITRATAWLLKGSVLELLIAVPCHVVVRRRDDCSAPMATSFGIATGLAIMLLSFGPSVLLLYKKRLDEYPKHRPAIKPTN